MQFSFYILCDAQVLVSPCVPVKRPSVGNCFRSVYTLKEKVYIHKSHDSLCSSVFIDNISTILFFLNTKYYPIINTR